MLTRAKNMAGIMPENFPLRIQQGTDFLSNFFNDMKNMEIKIATQQKIYENSIKPSSELLKEEIDRILKLDTSQFISEVYIPKKLDVDKALEILNKVSEVKKLRLNFHSNLTNRQIYREYGDYVYFDFFNTKSYYDTIALVTFSREKLNEYKIVLNKYFDILFDFFQQKTQYLEYLEIDSFTFYMLVKKGITFFGSLKTLRIQTPIFTYNKTYFLNEYNFENIKAPRLKSIQICPSIDDYAMVEYILDDPIKIILDQDNFPELLEIKYYTHFYEEYIKNEKYEIDKEMGNYIYKRCDLDQKAINLIFTGNTNFTLTTIDFDVVDAKKSFPLVQHMIGKPKIMDANRLRLFPNLNMMKFDSKDFTSLVKNDAFEQVTDLSIIFNDNNFYDEFFIHELVLAFPNVENLIFNIVKVDVDNLHHQKITDQFKNLKKFIISMSKVYKNIIDVQEYCLRMITNVPQNIMLELNFPDLFIGNNNLFMIQNPYILTQMKHDILYHLFLRSKEIIVNFSEKEYIIEFLGNNKNFYELLARAIRTGLTKVTYVAKDFSVTLYEKKNNTCIFGDSDLFKFFEEDIKFFKDVDVVEIGSEETSEIILGKKESFREFDKIIKIHGERIITLGKNFINIPKIIIEGETVQIKVNDENLRDLFYKLIEHKKAKTTTCTISYEESGIKNHISSIVFGDGQNFDFFTFNNLSITKIKWLGNQRVSFNSCVFRLNNDTFFMNKFDNVFFNDCIFNNRYTIKDFDGKLTITNSFQREPKLENITIESSNIRSEIVILVKNMKYIKNKCPKIFYEEVKGQIQSILISSG